MFMGEKEIYPPSPQGKKFSENKGIGQTDTPQKTPFLYSIIWRGIQVHITSTFVWNSNSN